MCAYGTTAVLRVELGYTTAGGYRLRVGMLNNSTTWTNNPAWVNITDAPHVIELDWQSSTTGSLNWWIDETQQTALTNVDNSNRRIDRVRLGAVAGVDATTNGTTYFDAFESRRSTYIGPVQGGGETTTTITYIYDPLYRLKEANYSDGRYFRYTYDSVGNRLTEEKCVLTPCTAPITNTYTYDTANRLTSVNGQTYTWDDNGNLLNDGTSTYGYDAANRLTSVVGNGNTSTYAYDGLGDRVSQTVNGQTTNYVLDLNAGLTQVLAQTTQPSNDPTTYLYGNGRIGELQPGGFAYHLGDALGSVMQLTNSTGTVTLARSFEPYGSTLSSAGSGSSVFAFAGEQVDITGLSFNRARYYASSQGRFLTADSWPGDSNSPMTQHGYLYAYANPIRYTDPSGRDPWWRDCQTIRTLHNSMSSESYNFADWSRCARQRLDEIIEKNWPDGAETIFKIFEDDELQDVWGDEAGRTSADRLGWLLSETRGTEESRIMPSHTYFQFGGDCGFSSEFRDQQYFKLWQINGLSNQAGHFLTAVDLAGGYALEAGIALAQPLWYVHDDRVPLVHRYPVVLTQKSLRAIIGHEKIEGTMNEQILATSDNDLDLWNVAVRADERGDISARDEALRAILGYAPNQSYSIAHVGASLADMRLSLKGYRFATWISENGDLPPIMAGRWLRNNLGEKTLINERRR